MATLTSRTAVTGQTTSDIGHIVQGGVSYKILEYDRRNGLVTDDATTSYTLVLTDENKLVTLTNASAITLTIPTNASVAFPIGTQIDLSSDGAWATTIWGAWVTINSKGSLKTSNGQYVWMTLVKTATDIWNLYGDLVA